MMTEQSKGTLYIVATPIGNLADMTQRGIDTLRSVDRIAAEDTRHSGRLLQHFNITAPLIAYHDHSDRKRLEKIYDYLLSGESIALISDAGTPLISDPGYTLVSYLREQGIAIVPIPGACAMVAALSAAGLPTDRFIFEGFLPAKAAARQRHLQGLLEEPRTLVFYESTHRIVDSLTDMQAIFGDRRSVTLARELTKTYETFIKGSLTEVLARLESDRHQQRGEFVVMLSPDAAPTRSSLVDKTTRELMTILLDELPTKQAASIAAKVTGLKKRDLYQWALEQRG